MPIAGDKMIELTRFSIGEAQFIATRVKPLKVIHLARRLAPILMVLKTLQSTAGAAPLDVDPGDPVPGKPAPKPSAAPDLSADKWLPALVEAVAGLSDDDANYVLRECLSVTQQVALHPKDGPSLSADNGKHTVAVNPKSGIDMKTTMALAVDASNGMSFKGAAHFADAVTSDKSFDAPGGSVGGGGLGGLVGGLVGALIGAGAMVALQAAQAPSTATQQASYSLAMGQSR